MCTLKNISVMQVKMEILSQLDRGGSLFDLLCSCLDLSSISSINEDDNCLEFKDNEYDKPPGIIMHDRLSGSQQS